MRNLARSSVMLSAAVELQGPRQLFGAAIFPIWRSRQLRVDPGEPSISCLISAAIVGFEAASGEKMNARSLLYPSPFTSPETIGVKADPERNDPFHATWTASKKL